MVQGPMSKVQGQKFEDMRTRYTSFPSSCLGTHFREALLRVPVALLRGSIRVALVTVLHVLTTAPLFAAAPLAPPEAVTAVDHPWDDGTKIDVTVLLSPDDGAHHRPSLVARYVVERSSEANGQFEPVGSPLVPDTPAYRARRITTTIDKCRRGEPYYFRAFAIAPDGTRSAPVETTVPAVATRQWFDGQRLWLAVIVGAMCGAIILFIQRARMGWPVKVRRIAALE